MNNKYDHISDESLFAYAAGELDESEKNKTEAHLSQCDECRKTASELSLMLHDVKECAEDAPTELLGNVMGKVAQEKRKKALILMRRMGAVAASLVLMVGLTFIVRNIPHEDRILPESTVPTTEAIADDRNYASVSKDTAMSAAEDTEPEDTTAEIAETSDEATAQAPQASNANTTTQTERPTDTVTAPATTPDATKPITPPETEPVTSAPATSGTDRPAIGSPGIGSPANDNNDKKPTDVDTTDTPDTTVSSKPEETAADNKNPDRPGDIPKWEGYNYTYGSIEHKEPKYTDDLVISCSEHVSTFHMIPKEFREYVGDTIYAKWRKRATSMQCCYVNTIWDLVRYCGISRSQFEEIAGCSIFTWYLDNADIIYNSGPAEFDNLFRVDK